MNRLLKSIRTIAAVAITAGVIGLGFQIGSQQRNRSVDPTVNTQTKQFADLELQDAVASILITDQWEAVGGSGSLSMGGGLLALTTDGCFYYDVDAAGNWIVPDASNTAIEAIDPFDDDKIHTDPFFVPNERP
ncbi:MAG: hypothetical protein HKN47_00475 [Pirellulaceae bacterium]|nr:hypothetical protein [Pirellulaceae bacterium]